MSLLIPQLDRVKDLAAKESLRAIANFLKTLSDNAKLAGNPPASGYAFGPPAAPLALSVSAADGVFTAIITPNSGNALSVIYFLESSRDAAFSAVNTYPLGSSTTVSITLGGATYFWRVRAKYLSSDYSGYVNFGAPTAVNGNLDPLSFGKNMLANPGFEVNDAGTPLNSNLALNDSVSDAWIITKLSPYHAVQLANNNLPRTGANALYIPLLEGVTIPNDSVNYETRVMSKAKFPLRIGDVLRVSGYRRWDAGAGPPAGVTISQFVDLIIYSATDAELGSLGFNSSTSVGSYTFVTGALQIPATMAGQVPSYGRLRCMNVIVNTGGAGFSTGAIDYANMRFDDLSLINQSTAFDVTPINTAGTFTSTVNPLSQSGVSTTILVASRTMQFGDGQVVYNSGSVNPGSLGTWYVYADDPTFTGGAVTYLATATPSDTIAANGRIFFGKITTTGGGGATGSGGGSGGGGPAGKGVLS